MNQAVLAERSEAGKLRRCVGVFKTADDFVAGERGHGELAMSLKIGGGVLNDLAVLLFQNFIQDVGVQQGGFHAITRWHG
jgi:hypothetical protein